MPNGYVKRGVACCERMICIIHYVYSRNIIPKNGVYDHNGGKSVQWELIRTTWENLDAGIRDLHTLYMILQINKRNLGRWPRVYMSSIEQVLKKLEEKLRCAKDVSKVNGFAREAMESNILGLWKSLLKQAWTLKVMRDEILTDLFQPLLKEHQEAKQH